MAGRGPPLPWGRGGLTANGFLFPPETVFEEDHLLAVFSRPEVTRLKGVFRCENGWIAVNRSHRETTVKPTAYRRDSRVEVFAEGLDWRAFEAEVRECVKDEPGPQRPRA